MIENEAKYIIKGAIAPAKIFELCGWEFKRKRTRSIYFDTTDFDLNENHISLRHKVGSDGAWFAQLKTLFGVGKRQLTLKGESSHDRNSHHASRLEIEPKYRKWRATPDEFLGVIENHRKKKKMSGEHASLVSDAKTHTTDKKLKAYFGVDNNRCVTDQKIDLGNGVTASFKVSIDDVTVRRVPGWLQKGDRLTVPLLYLFTFAFGQKIDKYLELEIELDKASKDGVHITNEAELHEISRIGADELKHKIAQATDGYAQETNTDKVIYKDNDKTKATRGYDKLNLT